MKTIQFEHHPPTPTPHTGDTPSPHQPLHQIYALHGLVSLSGSASNLALPKTPTPSKNHTAAVLLRWNQNRDVWIHQNFQVNEFLIGIISCEFPYFCNYQVFHIHIPIWQYVSYIHLAMPTKPPPILINSLYPNNDIQLTLYGNAFNMIIIDSCTLH